MSKKIKIASDVLDGITSNIEEAEHIATNNPTSTVDTKAPSVSFSPKNEDAIKEKINNDTEINTKSFKKNKVSIKKTDKVADRGPQVNLHLPYDIKFKLEDIKRMRCLKGQKVALDTIMYEIVAEWLDKHYDKEMQQ